MSSVPLSRFAAEHPSAAQILSSQIPNTAAAALISASQEAADAGFSTSEASVRRYREKLRPDFGALVDPQTPGATKPPSAWASGKEIDLERGTGELRTRPVPVTAGEPDPDEAAILEQFNLSPAAWSVTAYRTSEWQTPGGEWLKAARVSVRRREQGPAQLAPEAVEAILSAYTAPPGGRPPKGGQETLVVALGDLQVGKGTHAPDDPGTAGIVDRVGRCAAQVRDRIEAEFGGRLKGLVVVLCGDMIEGTTSQGGTLPNDLGVSEQVRVVRRLVVHLLATLAPYVEGETTVLVVPGNHDQTRRDRAVPVRDSWAIEACSSAAEVLSMDPQYSRVRWAYPPGSEDVAVAWRSEASWWELSTATRCGTPARCASGWPVRAWPVLLSATASSCSAAITTTCG